MPHIPITTDTFVMSDLDDMARIDGQWDAETLLKVIKKPLRRMMMDKCERPMTNEELIEKIEQLEKRLKGIKAELYHRAGLLCKRAASESLLTEEEIAGYANRGRSAFHLSFVDFAAVELHISREKRKLAGKGCVAFWPLIRPDFLEGQEKYEAEYRLLWRQ